MNQPSLLRYAEVLPPEGLLIANSSLARVEDVKRSDIGIHSLPLSDIAVELGNARLANMVALGAFAELSGVLAPGEVASALPAVISERNAKLIPLNEKAIAEGAARAAAGRKKGGGR